MTEDAYVSPNRVAFIIDNEVVEIIRTDNRIAAIWLSNPTIVNVLGEDGTQIANVGDIYDPVTQTFSPPSQPQE